ncbi:hypothetical protein COOONC_17915 [Cooperia oncophora]
MAVAAMTSEDTEEAHTEVVMAAMEVAPIMAAMVDTAVAVTEWEAEQEDTEETWAAMVAVMEAMVEAWAAEWEETLAAMVATLMAVAATEATWVEVEDAPEADVEDNLNVTLSELTAGRTGNSPIAFHDSVFLFAKPIPSRLIRLIYMYPRETLNYLFPCILLTQKHLFPYGIVPDAKL